MKNDRTTEARQLKEVRNRAERLLRARAGDIRDIPSDIQKLVHELQVHQIELEMQNEELRRTQVELAESSEKFSQLYEFAPVGYLIFDKTGLILEANITAANQLGVERMSLINTGFYGYVIRDDRDIFYLHLRDVIETNTRQTCEIKLKKKDDAQFYAQLESTAAQDAEGNFSQLRAAITDITERKLAEEERIHLSKMGALGTMTAGIAHELNNPMMGMLNFIQYCLKHTSEDDKRYLVLQDAHRETKRCIEIVRNLLTFSRIEKEEEEAYQKKSLSAILDQVFRLLSYRIEKENVMVIQQIAEPPLEICIKASNIQQVFLNLVDNALYALQETKTKEIHVDIRPTGEFVRATIADNGFGIPSENLRRLFDPFFTTKPPGKAIGLGLSICHSIVEAHGGKITCESQVGKGTKFAVVLPIERD